MQASRTILHWKRSLFDNLQISRPDVCLDVVCENLNDLTGQVMSKFELYLQEHPADVVIVVDDLASTMAAAIVTKKQAITLAHIAAGTRSFDITMPKEINRLVIDGLSDVLFTAGLSNNSIANKEGAELSEVYMVGNILIDNIRYNRERMGGMSFDSISTLKRTQSKGETILCVHAQPQGADERQREFRENARRHDAECGQYAGNRSASSISHRGNLDNGCDKASRFTHS